MRKKLNSISDVLCMLGIVAIVWLAYVLLGAMGVKAYAGQVCRPVHYVSRAVVQDYRYGYDPIVRYRVAEHLEEEAADTVKFRRSAEWQELQELRAWKAGALFMAKAHPVRPEPEPVPAPEDEDVQVEDESTTAEVQDDEEPSAEDEDIDLSLAELDEQHCATCHDKDKPPKGVFIGESDPIAGIDDAEDIVRRGLAVAKGKMPKGHKFTPQEEFDYLRALFLAAEDKE